MKSDKLAELVQLQNRYLVSMSEWSNLILEAVREQDAETQDKVLRSLEKKPGFMDISGRLRSLEAKVDALLREAFPQGPAH